MRLRLKLGLVVFGVLFIFGVLTRFYIIGTLESDATLKLEQNLIRSYQIYSKAKRTTKEERLDTVRALSKEKDLIDAIQLPSETQQEADDRHFKLFEKLEILSRLKYFSDVFIVLDKEGQELARTQVATWRKNKFGDKPLVKDILAGKSKENVWILGNKIMLMSGTAVYDGNTVIGALLMGNVLDEDLIKQESQLTTGELAFFSKDSILASSLDSQHQEALNQYVKSHSSKIAAVLLSKNDYFEDEALIMEEEHIIILSPIVTGYEHGIAGFMIIGSKDKWLSKFVGSRNFTLLLTILLTLLGISASFLIIQRAYDAIDFILEGTHQIIIGNKDYQFASDDHYLNQLGQTINLALAILMGKYIPEDEEEAQAMSMRGSLDTGKVKGLQEKMLIETLEEGEEKESGETVSDEGSYYDSLFEEFIRAKRAAGEDISLITKDRMIQKLKRAEEKLIEKHKCNGVRFNVKTENGKVSLKPTPIWD